MDSIPDSIITSGTATAIMGGCLTRGYFIANPFMGIVGIDVYVFVFIYIYVFYKIRYRYR